MALLLAWNHQSDAVLLPLLLVAIIFALTCYLTRWQAGRPDSLRQMTDLLPTDHLSADRAQLVEWLRGKKAPGVAEAYMAALEVEKFLAAREMESVAA